MIIALIVLMVLFLIGSVIMTRAIGNAQIIVNRQNNFSGIAQADAGLSDALFRIDQGPSAWGTGFSSSTPYFYVQNPCPAGDTQCVATQVPGAPGVSYIARANSVNPSTWTIQSLGTVQGVLGALQESVSRSAEYPFALFGNTGLNFNGKSSGGLGNYTPGNDNANNPSACTNSSPPGCVAIGSNGTITCNGGLPSSISSVYYSGGGGIAGSCGAPQGQPTLYNLAVPQSPAGASSCPGLFDAVHQVYDLGSSYGFGSLSPGTYACSFPVKISGTLSISQAADTDAGSTADTDACTPAGGNGDTDTDIACLYVVLSSSQYGQNTNALDITGGSEINIGFAQDPPPPDGTLPDATQFQVYTNSTGTVGDNNGGSGAYYFGGILYAPQASLTGNGCKSVYYGAAIVNTLTCNGGPNLTVYYDDQLSAIYGSWNTSGFTQISPGSVNIP